MIESFLSSWNNTFKATTVGFSDLGSLHPVVVHIPIGLLLIAPLFIVLGLIFHKSTKTLYFCALSLLVIGTLSVFLAVITGEKASELVKPNPDVVVTLERHDHLAERMRTNFSILTSIFMAYLLFHSPLTKRFSLKIHQTILILFLIIYAYNLILLVDTAHYGGKLVHYHGITSQLYSDSNPNK